MAARSRGERGAATAELALGIPLLVALTAGLVWMLAVGAAQVRVVDASREAARVVARGDDAAAAEAVARRIAPASAKVRIDLDAEQVVVTTSARVAGPVGLLGSLLAIQLVPYGRDHGNPPLASEPPWDSPVTLVLAKQACFDCHSI